MPLVIETSKIKYKISADLVQYSFDYFVVFSDFHRKCKNSFLCYNNAFTVLSNFLFLIVIKHFHHSELLLTVRIILSKNNV